MIERVCVVGGGSIGSLFAGHLASVAEVSVLTRRQAHADALVAEGLRIGGRTDLHVRVAASTDPAELPSPDLVIVATKANGLDEATAAIEGQFPAATVMTTLNGLGAEEVVRAHGDWPIVSAVTFMSGTRVSDTHVEYVLDTETWLGPYEETPFERVEEIADLIARSGLKVAALTGLPHDPHFAAEEAPTDLGHLVHDLVDEGKAVARAAGIELHDDPWEMNVLATQRGAAHYPSMLEDVQAHRKTEIDLITGALVREAGKHGVGVPLHTALYRLVKAKEESWS
jgi:2-dehydropantoate 2-reductase